MKLQHPHIETFHENCKANSNQHNETKQLQTCPALAKLHIYLRYV